ncbi:MAG: UvrD-helicase domain-containing protein [Clostridia bacterium]|nr:UvrD-helicase domain-containing protein [Clostridia bacterium]
MNEIEKRYIAAKRKLFDIYYSNLNSEQRRAVFTINGPLLILAGAGSGKTTVLVKRISYMIKYGNAYMSEHVPLGIDEARVTQLEAATLLPREQIEDVLDEFIELPCPPYRVLAITFTNKAANEIKSRLAASFGGEDANDIWAGTFHSICMRILRSNTEAAGLSSGFSVYDTDDAKRACAAAMKRCNIDEKTLPIKSVMNEISRAKDRLVGADDYMAEVGMDYRRKQIARIYREYQSALDSSNALDFDDIIFKTVMLLRNNDEIRQKYQNRFRYVSVDEYQDTNEAQFALTTLLSDGYRNLMVVGDDDQSIYRFRGATIANILGFDRRYTDAEVIKLEQNYRSTGNILGAANGIIANNKGRHGKTLWTDKNTGELITVKENEDQNSEARYIAETISRSVREGHRNCRDFAVLYRTNAQAQVIETAFAKTGVPYRTLGTTRFYDRKEIRDMLAYLHVINNHADNERLKRIINEPKRKIGDKTVADIERIARDEGCSMFEVIQRARVYVELSRAAESLRCFAELIDGLSALAEALPLAELVQKVSEMSGYRQMLIAGGEQERDRLENVDELISGVLEYQKNNEEATLTGYLEEVALVADVDKYDESADAVILMTIHSSKGLEFPVVFLPGMEDGIFPGMKTITGPEDEMEEERRLAYVAVTRAKEKLYILYAHERMLWGRSGHNPPSRFIDEIPPQYMDIQKRESNGGVRQIVKPAAKVYYTNKNAVGGGDITVNRPIQPRAQASVANIAEGDRVRHRIFGDGEVLSVRNMGADIMYEVVFENVGTKKLMATYAKLTKI